MVGCPPERAARAVRAGRAADRERERLVRTEQELTKMQADLDQNRWDNGLLNDVIDSVRKSANDDRLAPRDRDILADDVRRWVIEGPAPQGLDRANWTHAELADHLLKAQGIRTSRSAVQRFCAKIDIRLYRPTYRYLRGDPEKQARAKEDLADLGKERRPVNLSS